jgi:cytochrome P450
VLTGAGDRLRAYSEEVLVRRRCDVTDPDSDMVASILLGKAFGRSLTPEEQMSMVRLILVGGFDTTSAALAAMMHWLTTHPGEAKRLRVEPRLIDSASEEIVRYSSPSTYLRREVMQDTELGGTKLRKGDSVLVAFGAANRDFAKFTDPDTVVPDRKPNPHVGFGAGHHRCIGSFIAKAQLRIALEEILARFGRFELDDSEPIEYISGLGQGMRTLPMVFHRSGDR